MTRPAATVQSGARRREAARAQWTKPLTLTVGLLAGVTILIAVKPLLRSPRHRGSQASSTPASGDLLTVLAHELRTPLNAIVGWTRVLQSGKADDAVTATALRSIAASAHAQGRLIEDIVDTMRAEQGAIPVRMDVIDLREPLRHAVDAARPSVDAAGLSVSLAMPTDVCPVNGDRERLQQAFGNLLANAVKFTAEGSVDVSLVRRDGEYEVHIVDTGRGIDAEFLPLVFTRFEQAHRTGGRSDGLGLGLAICRDLVEQHHGRIQVNSAGRGRGTTVVVLLPGLRAAVWPAPGAAAS